jgi:hypothetical protein
LRKRPIKQFERLMLRFGGAEILRKLTGKKFKTEQIETIYEWVDPKNSVF